MRTLVVGDVHLGRRGPPGVGRDLAALVRAHAGGRLLFAGDFFDLASEAPAGERARAIEAVLDARPDVRAALGEHLERGGEAVWVAGNHDAEIATDEGRSALERGLALGAGPRARLRTRPWLWRDGSLHVEHGHLYDPDNAPAHPLVVGAPSLGIHFTDAFLRPTQATRYLHRNDGTPLALFVSAFRWYGPRGPHVVVRYFQAAAGALGQSGRRSRARYERALGAARLDAFAAQAGIAAETLRRMLAEAPAPTLASSRATFARLYLDRVLASVAVASGALAVALGKGRAGTALVATGAALLAASWLGGRDRYGGSVVDRLGRAARGVAALSEARLVVFGHSHREALADGYANTASFAFPEPERPGRPFLEIEGSPDTPRAVRRYWA
jgi:predicted phosphodiesterase